MTAPAGERGAALRLALRTAALAAGLAAAGLGLRALGAAPGTAWVDRYVLGHGGEGTAVFLLAGAAPVPLLIFAGAFNGLILPVGVGVLLWVALRRKDLLAGYEYPRWLAAVGVAGWLVTIYLGWRSLEGLARLFG